MTYAAKVLTDAKTLMAARGWRSGLTHDNNYPGGFPIFEYPISAYDAIVEAGRITAGPAVEFMRKVVSPDNPRSLGIIEWNDAHHRTVEQVNAAFDRAIEAAGQ